MIETPNRTQIEPSAEAIAKAYAHVNRRLAENYDVEQMSTLLAVAYAIDLAPIIAERDRMKAALIALRLQALQSSDLTATEWGQEAIDLANGAIGDYQKPRAALEPKL